MYLTDQVVQLKDHNMNNKARNLRHRLAKIVNDTLTKYLPRYKVIKGVLHKRGEFIFHSSNPSNESGEYEWHKV